jgi:hypothetical protein
LESWSWMKYWRISYGECGQVSMGIGLVVWFQNLWLSWVPLGFGG